MPRKTALFVSLLVILLPGFATHAQVVEQLTFTLNETTAEASIDDAGTVAFARASAELSVPNPGAIERLVKWDLSTYVGEVVTTFPIQENPSVDDSGNLIAIVSDADPLGTNTDGDDELFLVQADGTGLVQLTNDSGAFEQYITAVYLSGSGNRVAFVSDADPLGTNPDANFELFVVDADGTNLTQLTVATAGFGLGGVSISDNGAKIAFSHGSDFTGGNPDLNREVFVVSADGTGLIQLTDTTGLSAGGVVISGNGKTIAYEFEPEEIFVVQADGNTVPELVANDGKDPSITDDANYVYFAGDVANRQLWRVKPGSAPVQLTFETGTWHADPVIAGGGTRMLFTIERDPYPSWPNLDEGLELITAGALGGQVVQLTSDDSVLAAEADIAADTGRIVFVSIDDPFGTNPDRNPVLFTMEADGSGLAQITTLEEARYPSITADGETVVFEGKDDSVCGSTIAQVFRVNADGSGLLNLTAANGCVYAGVSDMAADGGRIAYQQPNEVYSANLDGTGATFIDTVGSTLAYPRVSDDGNWMTYTRLDESFVQQVYLARTDGTSVQQITQDPFSSSSTSDINGDGTLVVYGSVADPLGQNADGLPEIFLYDVGTDTTTQLTVTPAPGRYGQTRISADGAWVYCLGSWIEPDYPGVSLPYRIRVSTGEIERVGAFGTDRFPPPGGLLPTPVFTVNTDRDGSRAVFSSHGDWTAMNGDRNAEVVRVDYTRAPAIRVDPASPTLVSWDVEPQPLRYDVLRGDVAELAFADPDMVDLGTTVCLEDDSDDTSTAGFEDAAQPAPGQALFYLYRGQEPVFLGDGSWGTSSDGRERSATGTCTP